MVGQKGFLDMSYSTITPEQDVLRGVKILWPEARASPWGVTPDPPTPN